MSIAVPFTLHVSLFCTCVYACCSVHTLTLLNTPPPQTPTPSQAALQRFDPSLDPGEAALPLTRIPGLGLPTPVPIPNLQRLYFKVGLL